MVDPTKPPVKSVDSGAEVFVLLIRADEDVELETEDTCEPVVDLEVDASGKVEETSGEDKREEDFLDETRVETVGEVVRVVEDTALGGVKDKGLESGEAKELE